MIKNLIHGSMVGIMVVALAACVPADPTPDTVANEYVDLVYGRDPRTNVCFAYRDASGRDSQFNVECTPEVMTLAGYDPQIPHPIQGASR